MHPLQLPRTRSSPTPLAIALTIALILPLSSCTTGRQAPTSQARVMTGVTEYYRSGTPRPTGPDSIAALASYSAPKAKRLSFSNRDKNKRPKPQYAAQPKSKSKPKSKSGSNSGGDSPSGLSRFFASLLPTAPAAGPGQASSDPPVFANPDGTTSRVVGNTLVRSDGVHGDMIGNTIYYPNGTRGHIVGNTIHNPDGSTSRRIN